MERNDIIRMAQESEISDTTIEFYMQELERFAALVAAAARAEENEACAKVCEDGVDTKHPTVKGHIMKDFGKSTLLAAAIRARGNT